MPQPLPFAISSPALTHLLDLLEKAAAFGGGFEPGLIRCFGYESGDSAGRITERLMEEHFCLASNRPDHWLVGRNSTRVAIGRHAVWVPRATLDALRGKTLTLENREVGVGGAKVTRDFLVRT